MTPELIEQIAQRAHEIFAANASGAGTWGEVKNKSQWFDVVQSHHNHPEAINRKDQPNLQERSISQAYREIYIPASRPALVVPTDEKKGSKTK